MATPDSKGEKIPYFMVGRTKNKSSKFKDTERGHVLQSTTDLPVVPPSYRKIGLNSLGFHFEK